MNAEIIFNEFAKFAESNNHYYTFEKHGIIEDVLAFMGLPSKKFLGASSVVHADNLETLHNFLISQASDEQLMYVYNLAKGNRKLPAISPLADCGGKVFVSMPMNKEKCQYVDEIRLGIETALKNTGNIPYFLDKDSHNDNIYVKMLDEAGYAKALGKTVILTCKDTDFKNRHFDIAQVQTLSWKNADELATVLSQQIRQSGLV